jgi:hypothetical protein
MTVPVLWVICGAGRRVGKTTLALGLCRVLPGAVYAKQGTSRRRDDKPASYFQTDDELDGFLARETAAGCRHLVVESNALAKRGRGDIIIYLERGSSADAGRQPRPDAPELRAKAHVRLGCAPPIAEDPGDDAAPAGQAEPEAQPERRWSRLGLGPDVERAVINVLAAQDAWNSGR